MSDRTVHLTPDELQERAYCTGALIVNDFDAGQMVMHDRGVRYLAPLPGVEATPERNAS